MEVTLVSAPVVLWFRVAVMLSMRGRIWWELAPNHPENLLPAYSRKTKAVWLLILMHSLASNEASSCTLPITADLNFFTKLCVPQIALKPPRELCAQLPGFWFL